MRDSDRFQMVVEAPNEQARLIRVAGGLDRATAAALLRMIDAQLELIAARHRRVTDLLVDLEEVSSYEPAAVKVMRHARHSTAARGVRLHLTGCGARVHLLPLNVRRLLIEFSTYPTVEVALAALLRTAPLAREPEPSAQPPDGPGDLGALPVRESGGEGRPGLPGPRGSPEWRGLPTSSGAADADAVR